MSTAVSILPAVKVFMETSGVMPHPSVQVTVPAGFKIVGGGALDRWSGFGNLLTAAYPKDSRTWYAAGKDHQESSPASITGYALAIYDPKDEWDVIIKSATSQQEPHPKADVVLPKGYRLTGGGAFVDWKGEGNILTASYPPDDYTWQARSKDHIISDPATITAYAIGMKHRSGTVPLETVIKYFTGGEEAHPTARVCLDPGWTLSGGGALDKWTGEGNLLTASYPEGSCWVAAGKDHKLSSPARMTAFAIGIRVPA